MKEKIKNLSNKKIVITSLCVFAIVLLLGFTYAYWTRTFSQTGENTSTYDCFDISFSENTDGISMENGYPISDEEGLKTDAYEVTITNTCKTAASYNVVLNKLNTSTLDNSHVKIAVNGDIKLLSETETTTSTIENAMEGKIINTDILGSKASKTIKLQNWMDANTSESEGTNKTFSYKITIEAVPTKNILAGVILKNNKVNNKRLGFVTGNYGSLYIIKKSAENRSLAMTVFNNKPIGTNYILDEKNGKFSLTGVLTDKEYKKDYYICNNTTGKDCTAIYQLKENLATDDQTSIVVDIFTSTKSEDKILENGLFSAEDDEGISYYFSGKVENNYISFANKLWRVVRINGDGSIRIILENNIESSQFNTKAEGDAKLGYTFNNPHICTINNPCYKDDGEASEMKEHLENWYETNLKSYDNKIALTNYCNDSLFIRTDNMDVASNYYYAPLERIKSGNSTLKCQDTTETFGGLYKLKIGLLTGDEVNMAGFIGIENNIVDSNYNTSYLINDNYDEFDAFWTMSPAVITYFNHSILVGVFDDTMMSVDSASNDYKVRPVINLKSDVRIKSGNGTKNNPFIIE